MASGGKWGWAILLFAIGVLPFLMLFTTKSKMSGSIVAIGGAAKGFTFTPKYCSSGQRRGFFGVTLGDGTRTIVLSQDPMGVTTIRLPYPNGLVYTAMGTPCVHLALEQQNSEFNDVWLMDGNLSLDCPMDDLGRVHGQVSFENCH